uniref:DUF2207 domain-containing protein n=1 Tax=candidate division WOR-3 bacterium TaxID=2052148 RepID=A0A7V3NVU1_UNCW3
MFKSGIRLFKGNEEREKALPKTYLAFFLIVMLYLLTYMAPSLIMKFGLAITGLVVSWFVSISEDNYSFLFYYFSVLPILIFRAIFPVPGLLILSGIAVALAFWISSSPRYLSLVVDYRIPEEATPAEASFLLSKDIGPQELISTLYSLSLRGYLDVLEEGGRLMFHRKREYEDDPTLLSYEKFLLDKVFFVPNIEIMEKTGVIFSPGSFPEKIDSELVLQNLPNWVDSFRSRLLESLRYEKPIIKKYTFETKPAFLLTAFTYFVLGLIEIKNLEAELMVEGLQKLVMKVEPFIVGLFFLLLSFSHSLPLTPLGREVYSKVLGFREFMRRVERPRLLWLVKEKKLEIFNLLNYLYALNLLNPLNWVLEMLKEREASEEALLFTKLLKEVQVNWYKGKELR